MGSFANPMHNYQITEEERLRFIEARERALDEERDTHLVGTLGEKPVHKTLKYFLEPDRKRHEIKYNSFILDVMRDGEAFEVQTRAFDRLVPKLEGLTEHFRVTVVYPVIRERRLIWIAPEDGTAHPPRKVSKKRKISDILPELSKIKDFIGNENLTIRIYVISADEYRMLDGYGAEKKKRATKYTIIPTDIFEVRELCSREDCRMLIPEKLTETFTAKQFYSAIGMRGRRACFALDLLRNFGLIKIVGKLGNAYLYEKEN